MAEDGVGLDAPGLCLNGGVILRLRRFGQDGKRGPLHSKVEGEVTEKPCTIIIMF